MKKPSTFTLIIGGVFAAVTGTVVLDDILHNDEKTAICRDRQSELFTSFNANSVDIPTHSGTGDVQVMARYTLSREESPHWIASANNRRCNDLILIR